MSRPGAPDAGPRPRRAAAALVAALLAGAGAAGVTSSGCGSALRPTVDLTSTWPDAPRAQDFKKIDKAWTRHAVLRTAFQQVLDVHATFRSPAWRAAWAEREIAVRGLPADEADQLRAEARAAADGDYEITLVAVTYDREENDFDHGDRSVWRVSLVDDAGVETPAAEITRDRRPPDVLRTEVATYGDFAQVYLARFPRSANVLHPGAKRVSLKIAGTRGRVLLTWQGKQGD
ncbi:MAG TPA: hypothetical protein VHE35_16560 [Kofleriaceae bacterium]|nr:hypothetical protein [Kofleriaceae bacterium]